MKNTLYRVCFGKPAYSIFGISGGLSKTFHQLKFFNRVLVFDYGSNFFEIGVAFATPFFLF